MKIKFLSIFVLLISTAILSCSRGEDFYKQECIYHLHKDLRSNYCKSIRLSKIEKLDEKSEAKK